MMLVASDSEGAACQSDVCTTQKTAKLPVDERDHDNVPSCFQPFLPHHVQYQGRQLLMTTLPGACIIPTGVSTYDM